jgi:putative transposase
VSGPAVALHRACGSAAGVLLCLPTYSPWLNPIEMLWRQFRREVTPCELFANVHALLAATGDFCDHYFRRPDGVRSILGAHPA